MNTRMKLKHGVLHKRCNGNCSVYRLIVSKGFVSNLSCGECRFRSNMALGIIMERNYRINTGLRFRRRGSVPP